MLTCCCGTHALGRRFLLTAAAAALACPASAQSPPASAGAPDPALLDDLVAANRILADQGVVDGFGHVSVRHDKDPNRFLLSRSMAPALVTVADIMEFDLDGTPVDPQGRSPYLERFIHGEILRARPDVQSVVHNHSPGVIPFGVAGAALRPVYHLSGFLGGGVPVFEIRDTAGPATDMLVRSPGLGRALAAVLAASGRVDARPWRRRGGHRHPAGGVPRRLYRGERPPAGGGAAAGPCRLPE